MSEPLRIHDFVVKEFEFALHKNELISIGWLPQIMERYNDYLDNFNKEPLGFEEWLVKQKYFKWDSPHENRIVQINQLNCAFEKYNDYLSEFKEQK